MKERPILFTGPMVRAILAGRSARKKLYPRPGETFWSPEHLARRLANGLDEALDDACWVWRRSARASGHGTMTVPGRGTVSVYRLAYELGIGPIPRGMWVLHKCDNSRCINPAHLELGDQSKNMRDCAARGRSAAGSKNGMSKLCESQVMAVRKLLSEGHAQARIAVIFGVSQTTIGRVARGESFKRVKP